MYYSRLADMTKVFHLHLHCSSSFTIFVGKNKSIPLYGIIGVYKYN